jgi:UPF0271 protein
VSARRLSIDLNADLGEGCPWDEKLLERVTSASICCGAHSGDLQSMTTTLRAAGERGVVVGAHPGYPDREGFGRREQSLAPNEITRLVNDQLEILDRLARECAVPVRFVKPHGALYNQAQRDDAIAAAIIAAVAPLDLPVLGLPGSRVAVRAKEAGVRFIVEGFADRRYRPDGQLVPRTQPGAVLEDEGEIREQVLRLVEAGAVDTLCLHGDNPHSVPLADIVRDTLLSAGIALRSFS